MVVIGKTAVGVGGKVCDNNPSGQGCEWDPVHHLQNEYTSGHRQLMLDCLGVEDDQAHPSQQDTQVTIVQRHYWAGRTLLDVLKMQNAIQGTGAQVQVVTMEGNFLRFQAFWVGRHLEHGVCLKVCPTCTVICTARALCHH